MADAELTGPAVPAGGTFTRPRPVRTHRGRQAEAARNDLVVLAAAREVFATLGADAPVAAVAERAGVGIGSLYRRYGSKDDLLRHLCLLAMEQSIEAAEAALDVPDPWQGLAGFVRASVAAGTGSLGPLAGAIETTPEMWQASRRGRELLGQLVDRARAAGLVRADVTPLDIAHLIELFGRFGRFGPAVAGGGEQEAIRQRLLAIALDGLRPGPASAPLPEPAPTVAYYERRWAKHPG